VLYYLNLNITIMNTTVKMNFRGTIMKGLMVLVFGIIGNVSWGQTTYYWRNDQNPTSGQWNVSNYWWNGSSASLPGGAEILSLDGNVGTTMTNDLPSTNRYRIYFASSSASSRIINGSTTNVFYDYSNNIPAIYNNSGVAHTINFPIQIGNTSTSTSPNYGFEINASNGNLTFGSTISAANSTGTKVLVLRASSSGTGSITLSGIISNGSGIMSLSKIESNSAELKAANTYTGTTTVSAGTLKLNKSGGTTIPATNNIVVSAGTLQISSDQTLNDLTISSGGVTIDDGVTLTIKGTLTYSGGTMSYGSNTLGNLVISSSGQLIVSSGTFSTNGRLTLKSDAIGTASVGNSAGTISGNVNVERYIPAKRGWRALTAPVVGNSNTSVYYNWQNNGSVIANTGVEIWSIASTDASVTNAGSSSSLLSYNSGDNTWTPITNTNTTSLFSNTVNNPFMVFVTGPYATSSTNVTSGFAATTLKATGTLLTGTKTYATTADKYAFIGNPYASPLSLSAMIASNTSFSGNIWVWDANATGTYSVGTYNLYNSGTYTNITSNPVITSGTQIQSGQAFFIKSTGGASFSIQEAHKVSTFSNVVFRTSPAELLRVGLYKQVNNEWSGRDGAMTVILPDADANQVPNKMANGTENVAFTKPSGLFASNHHLPLVANDVLNVRVWNTTAGTNYKLKINTEQFATTNLNAKLEDLFTTSSTPIALDGSVIEYPFAVTTEGQSTGNRFRIVFQNSSLGINNPNDGGITVLPNPISGDGLQINLGTLSMGMFTYSICNTLGQELEKGSINNTAQNANYEVKFQNSRAAGIYIMKVIGTDKAVFTVKLIKK
jgi:autotransporter-associated beta strand protein